MKKPILLFVIIFCFTIIINNTVNAQWTQQNSGTVSDLYSVCFTDADHGIAVGINGLILKTDNGGQLWQNVTSATNNHLVTVCFPSSNIGYAAGFAGTIIKTINGGNNWTLLNSGTNSYINSLFFFNDSAGFAAGDNDLILYTDDGGTSWNPRNNGTNINQDIYKLFFVSSQIGYAAISENPYHGVLKTIDCGNSWVKDTIGFCMPFSIFFTDANTGFAVGSFNHIWKTVNGGQNWMGLDSSNGGTYYDLFFTNPCTGYVVGDQGMIVKTTDAGNTWQQETTNTTNSLMSVFFTDSLTAYVVGLNGIILKKGINTSSPNSAYPDNEFFIYPNPANENITIETPQKPSRWLFGEILNIEGQIIKNITVRETHSTIDISGFARGVYFVKVKNEKGVVVKKLIKE